jgi:hypothetical protein
MAGSGVDFSAPPSSWTPEQQDMLIYAFEEFLYDLASRTGSS